MEGRGGEGSNEGRKPTRDVASLVVIALPRTRTAQQQQAGFCSVVVVVCESVCVHMAQHSTAPRCDAMWNYVCTDVAEVGGGSFPLL